MSHKPRYFPGEKENAAEGPVPDYSQYLLIFVLAAACTLKDIFHAKKKVEAILQGVQF